MSIGLVVSGSLPRNSRVAGEIERTLRRGVNLPRTERNKGKIGGQKGKVEGHKVQGILDTPNTPNTPLDQTPSVDSRDTATSSMSESGASLVLPWLILYGVLITPAFSTLIFKPVDVWSDAHSLCMNSPP